MALSHDDFKREWAEAGESQESHVVETAWRRYQRVQSASYPKDPETNDLGLEYVNAALQDVSSDGGIAQAIQSCKIMSLPANTMPWTATGINVKHGKTVSTWASGRVWRSSLLDLYLRPQLALWFTIGVEGPALNSTGDSNTFTAEAGGELYVAN